MIVVIMGAVEEMMWIVWKTRGDTPELELQGNEPYILKVFVAQTWRG